MNKKSLLVLGIASLVSVGLFSCGESSSKASDGSNGVVPTGEYADVTEFANAFATSKLFEGTYEYEVKVWQPSAIMETTKTAISSLVDAMNKAFEENEVDAEWKLTFNYGEVGEGDAASNMITDITAGADIYNFAQDQTTRLIKAGGLSKLGGNWDTIIKTYNDESAISAVSSETDGVTYCYAFPATSDNGYYLYYNTDILSADQVEDLETMVTALGNAGSQLAFNYKSAWYNMGIFYANGCESTWETDVKGNFTSYTDTYASSEGKAALKGFYDATFGVEKTMEKTIVVDNSEPVSLISTSGAIITGTWDQATISSAEGAWKGHYACTDLPSFKIGNESKHLGSFSGNKLIGVKPQTDGAKALVCYTIADYLSSNICQAERYATNGWGPSNKTVAASDEVKAAPHLQALAKQNEYAVPQGQYPGDWWTLAAAITTSAAASDGTQDALDKILDTYNSSLDSCLTVITSPEDTYYSMIGSFAAGSLGYEAADNWTADYDLTPNSGYTVYTAENVYLQEGDSWKIRLNHKWDSSWGYTNVDAENSVNVADDSGNIKTTATGYYDVSINADTKSITVASHAA